MIEAEWLAQIHPYYLWQHVRGQLSDRKFRLFHCALCRQRRDEMTYPLFAEVVYIGERIADGMASPWLPRLQTIEIMANSSDMRTSLYVRFALEGCIQNIEYSAPPDFSLPQNRQSKGDADLFRHIVGNPFRPVAVPDHWPSAVPQLAQSLYSATDCAFALHDALLDIGHAELAAHFQTEQWHPKGCWALDLILGKR